MATDRKDFIRAELKGGATESEVRIALISQGYGTADFEAEYAAVCEEMGVTPNAEVTVAQVAADPVAGAAAPAAPAYADPDPTPPAELPGFGAMVGHGFRQVWLQLDGVMATVILFLIAAGIQSFVPAAPTAAINGASYLVLSGGLTFVSSCITIIASTALLYTFVHAHNGLSYTHGLQWSFSRLGAVIWLSLLLGVVLLVGFALLIVPGLALLFYSQFALLVLIAEDQRGVAAILRSIDLVVGFFWGIVWRTVFLVVISGVFFAAVMVAVSVALSQPGVSDLVFTIVSTAVLTVMAVLVNAWSMASFAYLTNYRLQRQPFFDASRYRTVQSLLWVGFTLGLLVLIGGVVYQALLGNLRLPDASTTEVPVSEVALPGGFNSFLVESRLDASYGSALIYGQRMTTYDGVCADVVVQDPVRCLHTDRTFVMYAPVGDGFIYCRDSSGYQEIQAEPVTSAFGCLAE